MKKYILFLVVGLVFFATTMDRKTESQSSQPNLLINERMDNWTDQQKYINIPHMTELAEEYWWGDDPNVTNYDVNKSADTMNNIGHSIKVKSNKIATPTASANPHIRYLLTGDETQAIINESLDLKFSVKASKTGTYSVALRNEGGNKSYLFEYTINSKNTWEAKTLNFTLPTGTYSTGTAQGLKIRFCLGKANTYATSPNVWVNGNYVCSINQVNTLDAVGNTFLLSEPKLERI